MEERKEEDGFNKTLEKAQKSSKSDYSIERRLAKLSPELHGRYRDCMAVSWQMLTKYENYFPNFTDHTVLHTLDILELCNQLIGNQLEKLTAEDLYILMMGALLHDVGMGISRTDFQEFSQQLGLPKAENCDQLADIIRDYHQELSGRFVRKYWKFLELPGSEYAHALIQVCRGHRKTDLMDTEEFPANYSVEPGKTVYLPYLAALLCLADELDISVKRNISFLYDVDKVDNPVSRMEFLKHNAIRNVTLEADRVVVEAWSENPEVRTGVEDVTAKLLDKLLMCRKVAAERSPFQITQAQVILRMEPPQ